MTDRGGPEPPAGGAALRGPRRVQTARVGCGSAVLGVAEPGRWEAFRDRGLGRRPRRAAGSLGSPRPGGGGGPPGGEGGRCRPRDANSRAAADSLGKREPLGSAAPDTYRSGFSFAKLSGLPNPGSRRQSGTALPCPDAVPHKSLPRVGCCGDTGRR